METLADLAARLRAAVTSEAYAEAERLVPTYCALLDREFRSHPPSASQARRVAEEAKDLYQWLLRSVIVDRAHCALELQRLGNLAAYLQPEARVVHTYEVEG